MLDEHPYCKDPVRTANFRFLLFHLGDTFFFVNELVKSQATSYDEAAIFKKYLANKRKRDARYGKIAVCSVAGPYFVACFVYGGWAWKLFTFMGMLATINATYDCGMFANFLINGMPLFKKLLRLDAKDSFSAIQVRLYMRWCASQELKKATLEMPKKSVGELVFLRSYRN